MSVFLKSLGGLFLLGGIVLAVYIVVAVATQAEGFSTLTEMIPAFIFHLAAMLAGAVLIGLGQRPSGAKTTA